MVESTHFQSTPMPCRSGLRSEWGETLEGELTDLGTGGTRDFLTVQLAAGRVVRLVLFEQALCQSHRQDDRGPRRCPFTKRSGPIGRRRCLGWDAAVKESPRQADPKKCLGGGPGSFSRKAKHPRTAKVQRKG